MPHLISQHVFGLIIMLMLIGAPEFIRLAGPSTMAQDKLRPASRVGG